MPLQKFYSVIKWYQSNVPCKILCLWNVFFYNYNCWGLAEDVRTQHISPDIFHTSPNLVFFFCVKCWSLDYEDICFLTYCWQFVHFADLCSLPQGCCLSKVAVRHDSINTRTFDEEETRSISWRGGGRIAGGIWWHRQGMVEIMQWVTVIWVVLIF